MNRRFPEVLEDIQKVLGHARRIAEVLERLESRSCRVGASAGGEQGVRLPEEITDSVVGVVPRLLAHQEVEMPSDLANVRVDGLARGGGQGQFERCDQPVADALHVDREVAEPGIGGRGAPLLCHGGHHISPRVGWRRCVKR